MSVIGIDLGTTNSVIAQYKRGETTIVKVDGSDTVPSVVYFNNGSMQVGRSAKSRLLINPEQCLSSTKRHIGSDWSKTIDGQQYTAVDGAAFILGFLKEKQPDMRDVVITIPAYFEEEQRRQTREAAEKAGLNVLRLLPEPTAAAIRYGFAKDRDQTILVVDLGGGTFDVSLLEVEQNDYRVKAVDGNHQLGGDDFDYAIVEMVNNWIENNLGQNLRSNGIVQQKLKEEAERVKVALASVQEETFFLVDSNLPEGIELEISRNQFKGLIQPFLDEITRKVQNVLNAASVSIDDINRIVLVGGSCKHPLVQDTIKNNFKSPFISDNMDTAVAEGAALLCANLKSLVEEEMNVQEAIAHSLSTVFRDEREGYGPEKLICRKIFKKDHPYPARGAMLGIPANIDQSIVALKAARGESDDPDADDITILGTVTVDLSPENIGKIYTPVVVIFTLDESGILTLTGVQFPPNSRSKEDIARLMESAQVNDSYVDVGFVDEIISKYNYRPESLRIEL